MHLAQNQVFSQTIHSILLTFGVSNIPIFLFWRVKRLKILENLASIIIEPLLSKLLVRNQHFTYGIQMVYGICLIFRKETRFPFGKIDVDSP